MLIDHSAVFDSPSHMVTTGAVHCGARPVCLDGVMFVPADEAINYAPRPSSLERVPLSELSRVRYKWPDQQLESVMANPYEWRAPQTGDAWNMDDVPACPGIYEVVSVDADGTPRAIPLSAAAAADEPGRYERAAREQFPGTLYIGKACNLRSRFGNLVKSWRSDAKPPYPHKSRETWDRLDPATKALYPFDSIRLRFLQMSKQDWERLTKAIKNWKEKKKGAADLKQALKDEHGLGTDVLWSGSGKDRTYEPVGAITTTERRRMETFKKYHGARPLLNRIEGETLGEVPNDAELKQMEEDQARLEKELEDLFEEGMS